MCSTYFRPQRTPLSNSHQIAGVIGSGLFMGLGQLLSTTGPLGVILVFLLVGSVALAFVLSSVPNSCSDFEVYFIAPWRLLQKWLCLLRCPDPSHIMVCSHLPKANDDSRASSVLAGRWVDPALGFAVSIGMNTGSPLARI
jgi:hypothetical protein